MSFSMNQVRDEIDQVTNQFAQMGQTQMPECQPPAQEQIQPPSRDRVQECSQISQEPPENPPVYTPTYQRQQRQTQPLDENDITGQQIMETFQALRTAVSVPLFSIVQTFEGNPSQFKQWVRNLERYAQMAKVSEGELPSIALVTCTGLVADFIKRYIDEVGVAGTRPNWQDLKKLLQKRFAEVTDPQQATALLRRTRQGPQESVQMFAERLLRIAEDAYPSQVTNETRDIIQKQLADTFCDGLYYDYLRMKVLREDPKTFESAVQCAMKEQNLRQRFYSRSNIDYLPTVQQSQNSPSGALNMFQMQPQPQTLTSPFLSTPQIVPPNFSNSQVEPMEIGHLRNLVCFRCNQRGHSSRNCPSKYIYAAGDSPEEPMVISDEENDNPPVNQKPRRENYTPKQVKRTQPSPKQTVSRPQKQVRTPPKQSSRNYNYSQNHPSGTPEWIRGAECWICHMIGHLKRNCPNRNIPERNRVQLYPPPPGNFKSHSRQGN